MNPPGLLDIPLPCPRHAVKSPTVAQISPVTFEEAMKMNCSEFRVLHISLFAWPSFMQEVITAGVGVLNTQTDDESWTGNCICAFPIIRECIKVASLHLPLPLSPSLSHTLSLYSLPLSLPLTQFITHL